MTRIFKLAQILSGTKPKLYFLIGYPASGKSWWRDTANIGSAVVLNRDEIVKDKAKELKVGAGTYDDMFAKLPKEIVPAGMPEREVWEDPKRSEEVDDYYDRLVGAAEAYNSNPSNQEQRSSYGSLIPFKKDLLRKLIVNFGRDVKTLIPFDFQKISEANKEVDRHFEGKLQMAVAEGRDIVIDTMSLSKGSRDALRRKVVGFIEGIKEYTANPANISKYYNQIAIVFAPETGYTPEVIAKLKAVNRLREEEEKARGESKTIPEHVYGLKYEPPSEMENFSKIEYVGPISFAKLNEKRASALRDFLKS